MSVYAYSSRRPRKGRPPSTPAGPIVQAPSGALINAVLGYADIQLDMGGGKIMLRMSEDRLTDPVIRQPLGREAARLADISVIWDEREDQIFRIIDSAPGRSHLAVVEAPRIDEPTFELTPAALAYLEAHRDAG
ncbi:MAG: hypothetical protein JWO72_564 [Caulobacteraceae bacterium]|nr:hypothetical protein [Caulobacteraceae bacterium]